MQAPENLPKPCAETPPTPVEVTAALNLRAYGAAQEDGAKICEEDLLARAAWAISLTGKVTRALLEDQWDAGPLSRLAAGVTEDGQPAGGKGFVAARRHGWEAKLAGVYMPDRAYRAAQEHAVRLLRGSVFCNKVIGCLVDTWPGDPAARNQVEWDALRANAKAASIEIPTPIVRNRTRQIAAWEEANGRLPRDITELESPPRVPPVLLLAAADRQLVSVTETTPGVLILKVKLPKTQNPVCRYDWEWVSVTLQVPAHVPAGVEFHTPTLRLAPARADRRAARLMVDLPFTRKVPAAPRPSKTKAVYTKAIGFDWGVNTLLTGAASWIDEQSRPGGVPIVRTDGRPYFFKASGIVQKLTRLRIHGELLQVKIAQLEKLIAGTKSPYALPADTVSKLAALKAERRNVGRKRARLGKALAWAAAAWALDAASLRGAEIIFIEDLAGMEANGLSRKQNARVAYQVRAEVFAALTHLAALKGMLVVEVPARGTSKYCPNCLGELRHQKAPNDPAAGTSWSYCKSCAGQGNRDYLAAVRIGSRGLAGQGSIFTPRASGRPKVKETVDVKVRKTRKKKPKTVSVPRPVRSRDKAAPTPRQVSKRRVQGRLGMTRSVPATSSLGVKCPAGTSSSPAVYAGQAGSSFPKSARWERSLKRRASRRRVQGRGFHPLNYPSWVGLRVTPSARVTV